MAASANSPTDLDSSAVLPALSAPLLPGATARIRVQTEGLLAPLREPALPAKQFATLDRLSGEPYAEGIGQIGPRPTRRGGPEVLFGAFSPAGIRRAARLSRYQAFKGPPGAASKARPPGGHRG